MKGERILNRDGKKKLNRQNLMILIVDLVLIIIFIGGFGWGIGTVKRYQVEPNTSRTETNTDSLYGRLQL